MDKLALEDLGYSNELAQYRSEQYLGSFGVGRIILEHKERYIVKTDEKELEAELIGNLRFSAESRYDFPAVGDWVAIAEYDSDKALIHAVYPRSSIIERKAVAKTGQTQIIATNVDYGLIVQAVDRDFSINRLERYLTICYSYKVEPVIVLSKTDLIDSSELETLIEKVRQRIQDVPVITVSIQAGGYDTLESSIEKGKTYCLLGSSGVGKSTIVNALSGDELMKTGEISAFANRGKHVTSHRELIVLNGGGILIDNPGMREVGIADSSSGLETTFDSVLAHAKHCRYSDCTHEHEQGCAVLEAVKSGEIDEDSYANFLKMQKEKMHFEMDSQERKRKNKSLGKLIKNYYKDKNNNKY